MKAKIAALAGAVLVAAAVNAPAALNAYRTGITLPQAVKLADGSVLPAGKYDVEIDYRGYGNAAELRFLQGGVLKGRAPAEARGFSSQPPASGKTSSDESPKEQKVVKLDPAAQKGVLDAQQKGFPKVEPGPGASEFSWGAYGFHPGAVGRTTPQGQSLKLSFDSANGPSGFSALLPAVRK